MHPVDMVLLARLLYEERLMEADQDRRLRQRASQRPPLYLRLRLWTGERLVRLGNRLMANYPTPQYQSHNKELLA